MWTKLICEFLGTMMLILLGDGVVANVTLDKSGMKGGGPVQITIAMWIMGNTPGSDVIPYIIAQFFGAFIGACLVYILYKGQFDATEDPGTKLGVIVGTFVLVFAILGIGNVAGCASGVEKLLVFGIIVSIGMSLGGLTGYAINPARDFGPRCAHAVLPIKGKGSSNFAYGWIPIVGPIIGGVIAALLFKVIPW